jgi:hypothetical protein
MIGHPSEPIEARTIPLTETDILVSGLASPVIPGTYWIVFRVNNYNSIHDRDWEAPLNNHVIPLNTNVTERGRSLSYAAEPRGADWSEFYNCQILFRLYGDSAPVN